MVWENAPERLIVHINRRSAKIFLDWFAFENLTVNLNGHAATGQHFYKDTLNVDGTSGRDGSQHVGTLSYRCYNSASG